MAETEAVGTEAPAAVEAAAIAAAETTAAIDTVRENAEIVVAAAEARADAAEEVAELHAQAAIHTALGNRVENVERELDACRTKLAAMELELLKIPEILATISALSLVNQSRPPTVLTPAAPSQIVEIPPQEAPVDPTGGANADHISEAPPPQTVRRKKFV